MATQTASNRAGAARAGATTFERFAGFCAILAGASAFLYAVAFIILRSPLLSALFLMLLGLLSATVMVGLYYRLRETDAAFALWAVMLGIAGALGAAVHGGYDLANAINASEPVPSSLAGLPSQVDPRGLLTFGVTGIALFGISWLISRDGHLPKNLAYLGYLSAVLLVVLYLGRLVVLNPASPIILVPALLNGFIVAPAWYIWLGLTLDRGEQG